MKTEIWKVQTQWDGLIVDCKFIPDTGWDAQNRLERIKVDFIRYVEDTIWWRTKRDAFFVYSVKSHSDDVADAGDNLCDDSAALLQSLPSYPSDAPMFRTRYSRGSIRDWLLDNRDRWLTIDVLEYDDIKRTDVQREIDDYLADFYLEDYYVSADR